MFEKKLSHSPVQSVVVDGHRVFIKRDDLLDAAFSGNKARKLYYLLANEIEGVHKLIGHGSAQSNLLYSLSELAKLKQWQCDFYVDHIPAYLRDHPAGNYQAAIDNGVNIISLQQEINASTVGEYVQQRVLPKEAGALFVPEGGCSELAEQGIQRLAEEILSWVSENNLSGNNLNIPTNNLKVMLPSGTGTTALYLQKHLPFEVLTCACVGGDDYLKRQFATLSEDEKNHPRILPTTKKYHFGKLYREFYDIWVMLKQQTGIEFELLYDPLGWMTLLDYMKTVKMQNQREGDTAVLYIHQGGLQGNATMLPRYLRKLSRTNSGE